jgi:branched-chain amino acid transport system substrate-binding protein
MEKKKSFGSPISRYIILMLILALSIIGFIKPAITQAASEQAPDKIRFGCAISLSGMFSGPADTSQVSQYKLWVEQTNEKGGIFVPKYNKKIPVELILYDDRGDVETCVKMVEKLILQDNVDFMLPPWGTSFNYAVAPIATKYKHIMLAHTISSATLQEKLAHTPYFFVTLNQPPRMVKATLDLMKELKVRSVAIFYIADSFGLEHWAIMAPMIGETDIKVPIFKAFPLGSPDMSILLKRAMAAKVDGIISYGYPDSTFLLTKQMTALGYNPKFVHLGVGTAFCEYRDTFGAAGVEGVMSMYACNPKMPGPGLKEYFETYKKKWGRELSRGTEPGCYAGLQVLEQAIAKVGDLDRTKIRDVIAKDTFNTIIGPVNFVNQLSTNLMGDLGQWQNGEYEVIWPKEKRTANPIYPKPKWPSPKK